MVKKNKNKEEVFNPSQILSEFDLFLLMFQIIKQLLISNKQHE